jgi:hypothetical protein
LDEVWRNREVFGVRRRVKGGVRKIIW